MMIRLLAIIIIIQCIFAVDIADKICEQNVCDDGYFDKTGGDTKHWACGKDCPGGAYWTDGYCNCACVDIKECVNECTHNRGPCNDGYQDVTDGNFNYWSCGADCEGGAYYTDGTCGCACQEKPDYCPDGLTCYDQGPCDPGYMDKTNGNANYWDCGEYCQGGEYWTDGTCGCACVYAGQCALTPSYHDFNLYRYIPQLSFIRTFGIFGEYLAIGIIIISLLLCLCICYKKKIKPYLMENNKYKVVYVDESSSEIENVPINQ